ncbi:hypothetical protein L3049_15105 [Labilibaculum sp. DW002]|uniref:GHMP kinase n=1 Tax=Paralabilibaculum antarcticum TaxID=2912572 RepID=A0ABT5VVI9_9BACT|nr:GYDIA family GHMP kinase [Labilibaculum sp. DW002]MDE5419327.1 hypothetical protein [Labilibaculum sp. DW002]
MKPLHKYYSNAKFLLTGEYLILHGALALAIPLKFGQILEVYPSENENLEWLAMEKGKTWLSFSIAMDEINKQTTKGHDEKDFVCFLLNKAKGLNPSFLTDVSVKIKTEINFDRNWGLGSSSTLINNIAQWAEVNPYELHSLVSNGSGYDVACANYCKPILFRRNGNHPLIYPVDFNPEFLNNLYFVYLGKKQKSEESVRAFLDSNELNQEQLDQVSKLSKDFLYSANEQVFDSVVQDHEKMISELLNQDCVREKHFADFKGSIKSLGAWGGDFVLVRSDLKKRDVQSYFFKKGLTNIFSWKEMILGAN